MVGGDGRIFRRFGGAADCVIALEEDEVECLGVNVRVRVFGGTDRGWFAGRKLVVALGREWSSVQLLTWRRVFGDGR